MQTAYIKLVSASTLQSITMNDIKSLLNYYIDITSKTGNQLNWEYANIAFPYVIKESADEANYLYLQGTEEKYHSILIRLAPTDTSEHTERPSIQVILPNGASHGDKAKANEFCKFLGKKLEAEVVLFNGRVMYFYKRK